jgi:hypothetical protein
MTQNLNRRFPPRTAIQSFAVLLLAAGFASGAMVRPGKSEAPVPFRDVRADAERFIDYYNSIRLTDAQERVRKEALESIPAPCCSQYSMATCCCPCNLAKSAWGLSHYLIAKKNANASEVRATVERWLKFVNPAGFTGNACFKGGCPRPFAQNGCGGMDQTRVIVGDGVM